VNEHEESAGSGAAGSDGNGGQPDTAPLKIRRRFRPGNGAGRTGARRVGAAVASRTAGWMVAAALAGAMITLLLVPARSTSTAAPGIPFRKVGHSIAKPSRSAAAGSGHGITAVVPAPRQVYLAPGRAWQIYRPPIPGQMYEPMYLSPGGVWISGPPIHAGGPGCVSQVPAQAPFAGPPPGSPLVGGCRAVHIKISRLPIIRQFIGISGRCAFQIEMAPPPKGNRVVGIPGRCASRVELRQPALPRRVVITRPGCVFLQPGQQLPG
jgi:hypothetical protein